MGLPSRTEKSYSEFASKPRSERVLLFTSRKLVYRLIEGTNAQRAVPVIIQTLALSGGCQVRVMSRSAQTEALRDHNVMGNDHDLTRIIL